MDITTVLVQSWSAMTFQINLGSSLKTLHPDNLIDIKYSTTIDGDKVHYSALIIHK